MKFTKRCTKCQSADIVRIPGTIQGFGFGNNIPTGATFFSAVLVTKYLCFNCGYIEDWVDNPKDIEKVKKYCLKNVKGRD